MFSSKAEKTQSKSEQKFKKFAWESPLYPLYPYSMGFFFPGLLPFQQPLEPFCAVTDHPKPLWAHQNKFSIFSEVWLHVCLLLFSKVTLSLTVLSASLLLRQQVALHTHNPAYSLANLPQGRWLTYCQGRSIPILSHPIFPTCSSQDSTLPSSS